MEAKQNMMEAEIQQKGNWKNINIYHKNKCTYSKNNFYISSRQLEKGRNFVSEKLEKKKTPDYFEFNLESISNNIFALHNKQDIFASHYFLQ